VALKCHEVDRGNSDPQNLLCVITDVDTEKVNYKFLTQIGPLEGWFCRNDLIIAKTVVLDWIDKVNGLKKEKELSVRSTITAISIGSGQGVVKCNCTAKCITMSCKCKKSGLLCNSKCHGGNSKCENKTDLTKES
jgi:hypothetical protein